MKICVYGLALNHNELSQTWYDNVKSADYVLVGDCGSTDNTKEILISKGAKVIDLNIKPFRFDTARNSLLAQIPNDVDIAVCCDVDQLLNTNWRKIIESQWILGTTRLVSFRRPYQKDSTRCSVVHVPQDYQWHKSVYEELISHGTEQIVTTDKLIITDQADKTYPYEDILLAQMYNENSFDNEIGWRYATLLSIRSQWDDSAFAHQKNAENTNRSLFVTKSLIYLSGLRPEKMFEYLMQATAKTPWYREVWLELATYHYRLMDFDLAYASIKKAIEIQSARRFRTAEDVNWEIRSYDIASLAAWYCGHIAQALNYAEKASSLNPEDVRLQQNVTFIKTALNKSPNGAIV